MYVVIIDRKVYGPFASSRQAERWLESEHAPLADMVEVAEVHEPKGFHMNDFSMPSFSERM